MHLYLEITLIIIKFAMLIIINRLVNSSYTVTTSHTCCNVTLSSDNYPAVA